MSNYIVGEKTDIVTPQNYVTWQHMESFYDFNMCIYFRGGNVTM